MASKLSPIPQNLKQSEKIPLLCAGSDGIDAGGDPANINDGKSPFSLDPELEAGHDATTEISTMYMWWLTFFSVIGGFTFGYDTGVIAGAIIILRKVFQLNSLWQEVAVSISVGVAALFSAVGGILNDRIGRKKTILISSVTFAVGAVILGAAFNRTMIIGGRAFIGVGIGLASSTIPMYVAECVPAQKRGLLVSVYNMCITAGHCVAMVIDGGFSYVEVYGWRFMLGLAAIPAAIQFVGMLFMPESPRYLISKGRLEEACEVLQAIRGKSDVTNELENIRESIEKDEVTGKGHGNVVGRIMSTPSVRRALLVGCGLQFFQQAIGINAVMYYSATILKMYVASSTTRAIWLGALATSVNVVCAFAGLFLVERVGRRYLTLISLAGVLVSTAVLALGFHLASHRSPPVTLAETNLTTTCSNHRACDSCVRDPSCGYCYEVNRGNPANGSCLVAYHDNQGTFYANASSSRHCMEPDANIFWTYDFCPTDVGWITTLGIILYLVSYQPGMGAMPWTVNSEIYPTWARSTGNAAATGMHWIVDMIVTMTFLSLSEAITTAGAFWVYSAMAVVGFIFTYKLLPETKGKTLEEMEVLFQPK